MKAKLSVYLANQQKIIKVTPALRALVKRAVSATLDYEGVGCPAEVSVTFTDNEQIHELNLLHRQVDRPTDVLSFPLGDKESPEMAGDTMLLGDIVISLEKAEAQAEEYGHSFEHEVSFLTVHSTLHLLGYDHETSDEDERDMFERQYAVMETLGFPHHAS